MRNGLKGGNSENKRKQELENYYGHLAVKCPN